MKKMVLIVNDKFAKCKAVDFDEIKFFKDYPKFILKTIKVVIM